MFMFCRYKIIACALKCHLRLFSTATFNKNPTAGVIIIGNEILKNQTQDTNSAFLIKNIGDLGIRLCRITVIEDDVNTIAEEVRYQSQRYNYVLTAGGLGPTHDDVTYEGVAKAVGSELMVNTSIKLLLEQYLGADIATDAPAMKLAWVPKNAKLTYGVDKRTGKRTKFPVVSVGNIFMFPGIPRLLEGAFSGFENALEGSWTKHYQKDLFLSLDEFTVAPALNIAVATFRDVLFGSYPTVCNKAYRVRITLEGKMQDRVNEAYAFLADNIPAGAVVTLDDEQGDRVHELSKTDVCLKEALSIIDECLQKYGELGTALSFNGGKDCTLLLHLLNACKKRMFRKSAGPIRAFYIQRGTPFPQVETFVRQSVERYSLDLSIMQGDMICMLDQYLRTNPGIGAIFLGSRRTDPGAVRLKHFSATDEGWPDVIRVSPLLDWSYQDVWRCLLKLEVPYCPLYDQGYSSIGNMEDSKPNSSLQYTDSDGTTKYRPAYQLTNGNHERSGRE